MASQKSGHSVTPGSGATLGMEQHFSGALAGQTFAFEGRTVPVQGASINAHVATLGTASSTDLLTLMPASTNYLRIYVASGFQMGFWTNGLDPVVTGFENRLGGDLYYDFPNILEMTKLYACGIGAACPVALNWEKTG